VFTRGIISNQVKFLLLIMAGPRIISQSSPVARFKMFKANVVPINMCLIFAIAPVNAIDVVEDEDMPTLDPQESNSVQTEDLHPLGTKCGLDKLGPFQPEVPPC
jgi:hypothetical protein